MEMNFQQRMAARAEQIRLNALESAKVNDPHSAQYRHQPEEKKPQPVKATVEDQLGNLESISNDMVNMAAGLAEAANVNTKAIQTLLSESEIQSVYEAVDTQGMPSMTDLEAQQKQIQAEQRKLQESIAKPIDIKKNSQKLSADPEAQGEPAFISNMKEEKSIVANQPQEEAVDETPKVIPKLLTRSSISQLKTNLLKRVYGQDEVIEEVVNVLKSAFVNLKVNKKKPAGSYFFAGPSGVGKTELARTLAEALDAPILIVNMGEYAQEHETSKLLGAPPGYLGFEQGGVISNFMHKNPRGIIVFDEIEKAHASADNILLSIMDQGVCQDNKGREINFKETIIISTSNLGARVEYIKGLTQEEKNELRMNAIKENLRTEIIGRYDSIFHFHSLKPEIYMKIVDKFLKGISDSAKEEHDFDIEFSDSIRNLIAEKSYDPALGGRPAGKFIEKVVVLPLADFMIKEEFETTIVDHPTIKLDLNADGNVTFLGKDGVVLGVQENTAEIIDRIEKSSVSKPASFKADPSDIESIKDLPKVSLKTPLTKLAPAAALTPTPAPAKTTRKKMVPKTG